MTKMSKEAVLNKIMNGSNNSNPQPQFKYKVGDVVTISKRSLKISYNNRGMQIVCTTPEGDNILLWRETINYLDLITDNFEVVIKKLIVVGDKVSYIARLAILEK